MEQCIKLRKEIEQAIRHGYLKEFIARCADKRQKNRRKNRQNHAASKDSRDEKAIEWKIINVSYVGPSRETKKQNREDSIMTFSYILEYK